MSKLPSVFAKVLFACLSTLFFVSFLISSFPSELIWLNVALGALCGLTFSALLFFAEFLMRKGSLKAFTTVGLGLIFGYLFASAVNLILSGLISIASVTVSPEFIGLTKGTSYLFFCYLGVELTLQAADKIYLNLPFVKLQPKSTQKRSLILDFSSLADCRLLDLARSGLLDNHLIIPHFIIRDLNEQLNGTNETQKGKARRSLEIIRKLEELPALGLIVSEQDFPETKDFSRKLRSLASHLNANILTADMSMIEHASEGSVKFINFHTLEKALKPLKQSNEVLEIKVQRYGKEARQGVGYLEDGTMVVINGGADFIGETIKTQVLSVKHTSSGRMVFCNALDEDGNPDIPSRYAESDHSAKNYFAL